MIYLQYLFFADVRVNENGISIGTMAGEELFSAAVYACLSHFREMCFVTVHQIMDRADYLTIDKRSESLVKAYTYMRMPSLDGKKERSELLGMQITYFSQLTNSTQNDSL